MKANIFKILGIENKELPVSQFFAWILDPKGSHECGYQFLNKFCECIGIDTIPITSFVKVDSEEPFEIGSKTNFIDIVIKIYEIGKVERIIAIENKVFSTEGFYQTQRYYDALIQKYKGDIVHCIYLTKNNSSVKLSNSNFIHKRYKDLKPLFNNCGNAKANYLIRDFEESYLSYNYKEHEDKLIFENFYGFCEYFVSRINDDTDLVSDFSKSSRSSSFLVRVAKKDWFFSYEKDMDFLIHYEIYERGIYLHFETNPYKTMKQLTEEKTDNTFCSLRETIRDMFKNINYNGECFISTSHKKNANLTIMKFKYINEKISYSSLYDDVMNLISETNNRIEAAIKTILDLK